MNDVIFFSHSSKCSTWIIMLESDYDDLSDNEKIQKFIEFDENVSDKCHDLLSCINKNRNMSQIWQKTVT